MAESFGAAVGPPNLLAGRGVGAGLRPAPTPDHYYQPGGELSHRRAVTVIFSPSRSTMNSSQPLVGLLISRSCSPLPPPIAQIETVSRVGTPLRWMPFDFT